MNNKLYVGKRVSSFVNYGEVEKIDGIVLLVDNETEYVAGSKDGYVLEVTCPYGTQAMADKLFANLGGKTYTGFSADSAIISPDAELGDGVTISGIYSPLASRTVRFGALNFTDIGAPGDSEINHEYKYVSSQQTELNRKLAQTRSYIDKTAEEIRIGVEGVSGEVSELSVTVGGISQTVKDLNGNVSELGVTVSGIDGRVQSLSGEVSELSVAVGNITSSVSTLDGKVSKVEQTAESLSSTVSGLSGDVSAITQKVNHISLSVTNGSLGSNASIQLYADGSLLSSQSIDMRNVRQKWANDTSAVTVTAGNITFSGNTVTFNNNSFIANSDNLKVSADGTITAYSAALCNVSLTPSSEGPSGNRPYAVAAIVDGNIYLMQDDYYDNASYSIYGNTNSGSNITMLFCSHSSDYFGSTNCVVLGYKDNPTYIHGSQIKSKTTINQGSDRDRKKNITPMPDRYLGLIDRMVPKLYRYTDEADDAPMHWGYIAQEVEEALSQSGMTRNDMAALVGENGVGDMGIGYTELIPLLHLKIRSLEERLERLEDAS